MTPGAGDDLRTTRNSGGVQSIERVFELLETMADAGGVIGLSQLASQSGLPLPTIHRLVRTLVDLGYVRQEPYVYVPSEAGYSADADKIVEAMRSWQDFPREKIEALQRGLPV